MDVYEAISRRKSVRSFREEEIAEEVISRLFGAARLAPSASNRQEWRFVAVRDPALRRRLSRAARGQAHVAQAAVVVACCAETDGHVMSCGQACYPIDVAIAVDHLTLCATAEGLGSCWIGAFQEDEVKEILGIPARIRVVALLALGHPEDASPVEKDRLSLEAIVRHERWQ
jgi:nitroreductase